MVRRNSTLWRFFWRDNPGRRALHGYSLRVELKGLLGPGGQHQLAGDDKGGAHVLAGHFGVVGQGLVQDDLKALKAAAVVEGEKAQVFHVPDGTGPAGYCDRLTGEGLFDPRKAGRWRFGSL